MRYAKTNIMYPEKSATLYSNHLYPHLGGCEQCSIEYKASPGRTPCWLTVSRSDSAADVHVRYVASWAIHNHY